MSKPWLCVGVLVLTACAHGGSGSSATALEGRRVAVSVDAGAVARAVVLCESTEAELRQRLGEPTRDGLLHGRRVLSWLTAAESPPKYLAVLVDQRGLVVDLYWDIPTEVPWTPTSQCADGAH
jgi:hypothetical protein